MPLVITEHAVDRYIQFHLMDQTSDREKVRHILEIHAEQAIKTNAVTHKGHRIWRIEALGCELVAKHDNGKDFAVTILPPSHLRGYTPLQAESIQNSIKSLDQREIHLRAEREALAQNKAQVFKLETGPIPAKNPQQFIQIRLSEIKLAIAEAQAERDIFKEHFHAITQIERIRATAQGDTKSAKRALRLAMKLIRRLPPSETEELFRQIQEINPDYISDRFIDYEPILSPKDISE